MYGALILWHVSECVLQEMSHHAGSRYSMSGFRAHIAAFVAEAYMTVSGSSLQYRNRAMLLQLVKVHKQGCLDCSLSRY